MSDKIDEDEGVVWRVVRALKDGEEPAPGNVSHSLNELAIMTGKEPLAVGGDERIEYERVK